jgi:intracellular multiplication protein IcmD
MNKKVMKRVILFAGALVCLSLGAEAYAVLSSGLGGVAGEATKSLNGVAKLITAASYVAGMAIAVASVVKFKAHKDNPTQIPIGTPIALLFVAAALIFIPSVFISAGSTLFGGSGYAAGVSGISAFGASKPSSTSA